MDENRGDVILETEHLCYSYDSRKTALQDVNLSVRKGERIAVLGSNGVPKLQKRTGMNCESTLELCFRRRIIRLLHQRWPRRFHLGP